MAAEEQQYIDLVKQILEEGDKEVGRNGPTRSIFGTSMRFSLANGTIPFMTHKRLAWKTCLTELIWFIRGRTDNQWLNDRGVHIWDGNATREFLDSRGLTDNQPGDLGPIYGSQWRAFDGDTTCDQLADIIAALKDPQQRNSRRLIMTAWNPKKLDQMALPPCHVMCQFNVRQGNKLDCALYQRSGDVGLGVPFNIASYSALTHLLAAHCGLQPGNFVYFLGNAHIYEEHVEALTAIGDRTTYAFPKMRIAQVRENINEYDVDDFVVDDYVFCRDALKMRMIA